MTVLSETRHSQYANIC